jgi:hypothetical protein
MPLTLHPCTHPMSGMDSQNKHIFKSYASHASSLLSEETMISTVFYIKAEQTFNSTKFGPFLHCAYFFMRTLKHHSSSFRVKNCKDSKHLAREEIIT